MLASVDVSMKITDSPAAMLVIPFNATADEDEFELSIPDEEAEKIQTVGQAIDYIKQHASK